MENDAEGGGKKCRMSCGSDGRVQKDNVVWIKMSVGGLEGWTDLGYVILGAVLFHAIEERQRQGMKDKPPTGIQKTKNECVCVGGGCAKSRVGEGCREDINKMPVLAHMEFKSVVLGF